MRRLVFCFDGTWNKIDGNNPTNVARIAQSVSRHDGAVGQIIYYDEGVGTTRTERWSGGVLGHGLIEKIVEAYHFLILNYEPNDRIYVFGFSRGAFAARSFVGLLRNCGIMSRRSLTHIREAVSLYISRDAADSPNSDRSRSFRLQHCPRLCLPGDREWRATATPGAVADDLVDLRVAYLGVWDTVGALGLPKHLRPLAVFNRKFQFHDTELSSFVERARHAVAVDERRRSFEPSLWHNLDDLNARDPAAERYQQFLFPGVHAAVGGGGPVRGLSDYALDWVLRGARAEGLRFDVDDQSPVYSLRPDHRAQLFNATGKSSWSVGDALMGVGLKDRVLKGFDRRAFHPSLSRRFASPADQLAEHREYRPESLRELWPALTEMGEQALADLQRDAIELKSAGDDRALRAPVRTRPYTVKAGDTLPGIAEREMGSSDDTDILTLHNRNVGRLFERDELYVGSQLEIPDYGTAVPQPIRTLTPPPEA